MKAIIVGGGSVGINLLPHATKALASGMLLEALDHVAICMYELFYQNRSQKMAGFERVKAE